MPSIIIKLLTTITLFTSAYTYAFDLDCKVLPSTNTDLFAKRFTIFDVNTASSDISFDGGLFSGPSVIGDNLITSFSNECDNMITVIFELKSIDQIKQGQRNSTKGIIHYNSLDIESILVDTDFIEAEIECNKI